METIGNTSTNENIKFTKDEIAALQYWIGTPDGNFITEKDGFNDETINAPKAYITLTTLTSVVDTEGNFFKEGKKQVTGLITPIGIRKTIELFLQLHKASMKNSTPYKDITRKCARKVEQEEGESKIHLLTSTTKHDIENVIELGYAQKIGLVFCDYIIHDGASFIDMEELGSLYQKPEEREILLLNGNKVVTTYGGIDPNPEHVGYDGKRAELYRIDVYPIDLEEKICEESIEELEKIVYDEEIIGQVRAYFEQLNNNDLDSNGNRPAVPPKPECYARWKTAYKNLVNKKTLELHKEMKKEDTKANVSLNNLLTMESNILVSSQNETDRTKIYVEWAKQKGENPVYIISPNAYLATKKQSELNKIGIKSGINAGDFHSSPEDGMFICCTPDTFMECYALDINATVIVDGFNYAFSNHVDSKKCVEALKQAKAERWCVSLSPIDSIGELKEKMSNYFGKKICIVDMCDYRTIPDEINTKMLDETIEECK